jgi:Ni,Fe-hydrogenase I cytochrome b subunit
METKNSSSNQPGYPFIQKHSASLRIWHWLTFLFITGSIVTVLFNSTLLSPRDNVKMVQEQLQRKGITVTDDQAFAVSHEYEDKMWDVHKLIGYGLAILFLARIIIEFTQPKDEKIQNKLKRVKELQQKNDGNKADYTHYLRVRLSYTIFFLLLFCMVLTGLGMSFGRDLGFSREVFRWIKNVHSIVQYLVYTFILIHLAGVIIAENGKIKGIVSGMVNGNQTLKS